MAKSVTFNRSGLAKAYDVSPPAIDGWVRRGIPHRRRRDGEYVFRLDDVREWRARQLSEDSRSRYSGGSGRRPIPEDASKIVGGLMLAEDHIIPWKHDQVVRYPDYAKHAGIDEEELFTLLLYGLPTLPPAPGEKLCRVSIPHADRWRTMFAIFVEGLGGDGYSKRLGAEAQRLRGLPTYSGRTRRTSKANGAGEDAEPELGEDRSAGEDGGAAQWVTASRSNSTRGNFRKRSSAWPTSK